MNHLSLSLSGILLIVLLSAPVARPMEASASGSSLRGNIVKGNTAFTVQLYRELGVSEGNLFFSPYSISLALGAAYAGASDNTAKEMKEVLHFQLDQTELHPAFQSLTKELAATATEAGQKLSIANALILNGGNVSSEFKSILKDDYDAEVFSGGLDAINSWVRQKTEGKIERILEGLSPDSACVILNAIYFKGIWDSQFKKSSTADAPFSVSTSKQVTVPLMYQMSDFKILIDKTFKAVSIPYKGKSLSMVILLPQTVDGLAAMEQRLTTQSLKEWLAKLDGQPIQKIHLYVPKLKLQTGYDLVSSLKKMGVKDAFFPGKADFSGMGRQKGTLWISQIRHKAFLEVNEEGTEAVAVTAVGERFSTAWHASPPDYPVFRADHPFLFIIRDNQSGALLFIGRIVNPNY